MTARNGDREIPEERYSIKDRGRIDCCKQTMRSFFVRSGRSAEAALIQMIGFNITF